jgi:DNA-binding FrmR family transcriptional regulator
MDHYEKHEPVSYDWFYVSNSVGKDEFFPEVTQPQAHFNGGAVLTANYDLYRNPQWKDQVRNGQNATTPLVYYGPDRNPAQNSFKIEKRERYFNNSNGQEKYEYSWTSGSYLPILPTPISVLAPPDVVARVRNRCISRFVGRAKEVQSSIEGGQDLGEIKQTIESIKHPLKSLSQSLTQYLTALRKRKKRNWTKTEASKVLADTYLEFHFGWQPLAADVAQLIADARRSRFDQYVVSASAQEVYQVDQATLSTSLGYPGGTVRIPYRTKLIYSMRMRGGVSSLASAGQLSWAQSLQLTPKDWLPTAWDLLPYSWIADYFVNIGDILGALSFVSSSLLWGSVATKQDVSIEVSDFEMDKPVKPIDPQRDYTDWKHECGGGNYKTGFSYVTRNILVGSDLLPSLEFRIPGGKYPYLNMGALLTQQAAGLVPYFRGLKYSNYNRYTE